MSLHTHFSDDKLNSMVNIALGHPQIHPAVKPSPIQSIHVWFLNLDKSKSLAMITACVLVLMLSVPMMNDTQHRADDESLDMMSSIVTYDSLAQLGS
jgi:hypothetical protein